MKLVLFFTRGVSLERWLQDGIFAREKLLYERHLADGTLSEIHWLTYGVRDGEIASRLHVDGRLDDRIQVWPMPRWFAIPRAGSWLYTFMLPRVYGGIIRCADVLKTNQLDGAWAAAAARKRWSVPLIVRCGYVQSKLEEALRRLPGWRLRLMAWGEARAYEAADCAVVASHHDERYVMRVYRVPADRIRVIPNFIDTRRFSSAGELPTDESASRWLFVGRLSPEKNLANLIAACARSGIGLDIVGGGPCQASLRATVRDSGADVRFLGRIDNDDLPDVLRSHRYFILPSMREGNPKTLLEAMACGLICVGTNVDGIAEVIEDGVDGFLSWGTDVGELCTAMHRAMEAGNRRVAEAAVRTVNNRNGIDRCLHAERDVLRELARSPGTSHDGSSR